MKNRKLKAIMGVSLAVMLAVPVSVFGISGAFGGSPKAQQSQTTASPLGLNPETDPVIMTTKDGLEIRVGGLGKDNCLNGYAYITTDGDSSKNELPSYNWVIIGYNLDSKEFPVDVPVGSTTETTTINTFDKYATIEGLEGATRDVSTGSWEVGDSPFGNTIDSDILSEIGTDDITYYKIDYTKTVTETETFTGFPNAVNVKGTANAYSAPGVGDLAPGEILLIAEDMLQQKNAQGNATNIWKYFNENYTPLNGSYSQYSAAYTGGTNLRGYLESIYTNGDFGLGALKENMVQKTLTTAWKSDSDGLVNDKGLTGDNVHKTAYLFPMATLYNQTDDAYKGQNFLMETYFTYDSWYFYTKTDPRVAVKAASLWWLRSGGYLNSLIACYVGNTGRLSSDNVNRSFGVRPAFVLEI